MQEGEEKKNKRYKSSGSCSFNTRESGEGSINLNSTVGDEEDEVQEVRHDVPHCDPYNLQKSQEMTELLQIKIYELELKAAELEI
ncbi:hypothetical protein Tco_0833098 [Tanacetum coccineum]